MKDKGRKIGMKVEVKDDFNKSFRIFSKKIQESGLLRELREKQEYEKPSVTKQRKKKQARKRWERQVESYIAEGKWHPDKKF